MMKKKIARLLAFVTALGLIFFLFSLYTSFYGNPIEMILLRPKLVRYVKENHPDLELIYDQQVRYNFKDAQYFLYVTSPDSEDFSFTVSYFSKRKEMTDDYEYRVANGSNTWTRLNSEYDDFVEPLLLHYSPHIELAFASLAKDEEMGFYNLDATMNFYDPPVQTNVVVWLTDQPQSIETLAQQLTSLAQYFQDHQIRIDLYSLTLRDDEDHLHEIGVYDFPSEKILNNPNLIEDLETFIQAGQEMDKEKK